MRANETRHLDPPGILIIRKKASSFLFDVVDTHHSIHINSHPTPSIAHLTYPRKEEHMEVKPEIQGTLLSDIKSEPLHWLWKKRIPTIQWLGTNHDPVASLLRGSTSLSLERQEILKVLQATDHPLGPKELAEQTGQKPTLVRQLLRRMLKAGDIISPAYGLYTTHDHLPPEILFSSNDVDTPTTPTTPTTSATLATPPHDL